MVFSNQPDMKLHSFDLLEEVPTAVSEQLLIIFIIINGEVNDKVNDKVVSEAMEELTRTNIFSSKIKLKE